MKMHRQILSTALFCFIIPAFSSNRPVDIIATQYLTPGIDKLTADVLLDASIGKALDSFGQIVLGYELVLATVT